MILGDLGADVVRVERPLGDRSLHSRDQLLRSRQVVALDAKDPGGWQQVLALAPEADVLVEGFRPGVAERLGVRPEHCQQVNPRLI
jgi:alpha-methylacyl-CoA racemase